VFYKFYLILVFISFLNIDFTHCYNAQAFCCIFCKPGSVTVIMTTTMMPMMVVMMMMMMLLFR